MATKTKGTRVREAPEPTGVIQGIRAAARKYERYGVTAGLISKWAKNGEVAVARESSGPGQPMLLGEASLRKRLQTYTPHQDNATRQGQRFRQTVAHLRYEPPAGPPPDQHIDTDRPFAILPPRRPDTEPESLDSDDAPDGLGMYLDLKVGAVRIRIIERRED